MTTEERMNSPKNVLMMLFILVLGIVVNPFVKLKDWFKGESE